MGGGGEAKGGPQHGLQAVQETSWRKNTGTSRVRSTREGRALMGVAVVGGAAGGRTQELERVLGVPESGHSMALLPGQKQTRVERKSVLR